MRLTGTFFNQTDGSQGVYQAKQKRWGTLLGEKTSYLNWFSRFIEREQSGWAKENKEAPR